MQYGRMEQLEMTGWVHSLQGRALLVLCAEG